MTATDLLVAAVFVLLAYVAGFVRGYRRRDAELPVLGSEGTA